MKVKFKLLQRGVKQRPYWHIIVQPDKKNLKGHYIEKVGYWMPRKTGTIPRGILLNKHRIRYWLSVGAQPTNGVVRLFNRFGNDFFPKLPTPFGSNSTFERPAKTYAIEGAKNDWEWQHNRPIHYRQLLQEQMNIVERNKRVQHEAMSNLGEGENATNIEMVKTDDFDSEEADVFERVNKFEELQRRLRDHRKRTMTLRGNDLRYNVYLKKMNKLTRKDLGLDVEAFKDYYNNLKIFARYSDDYEILADDRITNKINGALGSIFETEENRENLNRKDEELESQRFKAKEQKKLHQMEITIRKLSRKYKSPLSENDYDIVQMFEKDPLFFLDNDFNLTIYMKKLYDQRKLELLQRSQMGINHLEKVTLHQLKKAGVSQKEFAQMNKLMKMDPEIFIEKYKFMTRSPTSYYYAVDLSKYEKQKIPRSCRELLFRPKKMRHLYEKYWSIASVFDVQDKEDDTQEQKHRKFKVVLHKEQDEYILLDRIIATLDEVAVADRKKTWENKFETDKIDFKDLKHKELSEIREQLASNTHIYKTGFEFHANKIRQQIKEKNFCTKSQLEYLTLYNQFKLESEQKLVKPDPDQDFYILQDYEKELRLKHFPDQPLSESSDDGESDWEQAKSDTSSEELAEGEVAEAKVVAQPEEGKEGGYKKREFVDIIYPDEDHKNLNKMYNGMKIPVSHLDVNNYIQQKYFSMLPEKQKLTSYKQMLNTMKGISKPVDIRQIQDQFQNSYSLPEQVFKCFKKLEKDQSFKAKSQHLTWLVDNLRIQLTDYYEKNQVFDDCELSEHIRLMFQIEKIVDAAKNELFELHQKKKQGTYVQGDERMEYLHDQIDFFKDSHLGVISAQSYLMMVKEHNLSVDEFSDKFMEELPSFLRDAGRVQDLRDDKGVTEHPIDGGTRDQEIEELKSLLFLNYDHLHPDEQYILGQHKESQQQKFMSSQRMREESKSVFLEEELLVNRHSLRYAKLFHNEEGGYSMPKLKRVLKYINTDLKENQIQGFELSDSEEDPFDALDNNMDLENALEDEQDDYDRGMTESEDVDEYGIQISKTVLLRAEKNLEDDWSAIAMSENDDGDLNKIDSLVMKDILRKLDPDFLAKDIEEDTDNMGVDIENGTDFVPTSTKEFIKDLLKRHTQMKARNEREAQLAEGEEGEEAAKASDNESDGEENDDPRSVFLKMVIDKITDEREKEIVLALKEFIDVRQSKEWKREMKDFPDEFDTPNDHFSNKDLTDLMELYKEQSGENVWAELEGEEDEDVIQEKMVAWVLSQAPHSLKGRKLQLTDLEKKIEQMKIDQPELAEHLDQGEPIVPRTLLEGEFLPDHRGHHREMDRIDSNIGMYPRGFRHYQSYEMYHRKFPRSTISDYTEDMNSQITYEDYLLLTQKYFIYEMTYNPVMVYELGLDQIDFKLPFHEKFSPEGFVQTQDFKDEIMQQYRERIQDKLLEKQWFKKVDAFEEYTDYYSFGRGIKSWPSRGTYMPVRTNIMPRPRFRNYDKEDMVGKEYSLKTPDNQTVSPALQEHTSLKPGSYNPQFGTTQKRYTTYNYENMERHVKKSHTQVWRLNKKKRFKDAVVRTPNGIWRFSTHIPRDGEVVPTQQKETYQPVSLFSQLHTYAKTFKAYKP